MTKEYKVNQNSLSSSMIRGTKESSQELNGDQKWMQRIEDLGVSSVDLGFEPELVQQNLSGINVSLQAE